MKFVRQFDEFLAGHVNLNQTRIDTLKSRVDAVTNAISSSERFSGTFIEAIPQGSWAHRTIIKPVGPNGTFDADLVVYLSPSRGWRPVDYIDAMYEVLGGIGAYKGKVSRKTRCATIQYAGEFSVDIVPCIRKESFWETTEWILNRSENCEEKTNPLDFTKWLLAKNDCVEKNLLLKVIRLLKFLRDHKKTFSCKSVLLTTLVAERVGLLDNLFIDFQDVPTALRKVLTRLSEHLEWYDKIPNVSNPVMSEESFTRHWDAAKYLNFRTVIQRYAQWVDDAYKEKDRELSAQKWRKIWGDGFAPDV